MHDQPHSAEQFGAQRDFWWRHDFLNLMAARWRLGEAASLADIGCGQGHWSRLLYPYLRSPARLVAVDREPRWVAEAAQHFQRAFPQVPSTCFEFITGDANKLPLPDNAFEVVTCQTVLMHLKQPLEALREMQRIVRPGGLVICCEPNNLWNYLSFTSLTPSEPIEQLVRRFEFWLRYHRGKVQLGQGDHTIGDRLPGLLAEAGFKEIETNQSDRAAAIFPPYDTPEQRTLLAQEREWKNSAATGWNREELRQCVLAGGGSEELFAQGFQDLLAKFDAEQAAITASKFHTAGGGLFYLVSGRKM